MRKKLIQRGIPAEQVRFIHEATTDAQKKEMFAKVRSGEVRVLFGSTQKMGAGTNCQDRLISIHNLDCPWKPSCLEQRQVSCVSIIFLLVGVDKSQKTSCAAFVSACPSQMRYTLSTQALTLLFGSSGSIESINLWSSASFRPSFVILSILSDCGFTSLALTFSARFASPATISVH